MCVGAAAADIGAAALLLLLLLLLLLQVEYGDAGLPDLPARLTRFLPAKYSEASVRAPELANEIRKVRRRRGAAALLHPRAPRRPAQVHATHAGKSGAACEAEFLAYVREWQVYGSSFFFVEPQMNVEMPPEVFLAVNPKGILIIK